MSISQSLIAAYLFCTIILLEIKTEAAVAVAVVSLAAMFIAVTWLERKQNKEFDLLVGQVKELKSKVDVLLLAKGMGR